MLVNFDSILKEDQRRWLLPAVLKVYRQRFQQPAIKGNNIRIKDMFEYCVPGLYDYTYSQLSNFAHGGITKEMVRVKEFANERFVKVGCEYDEFWATYTSNILYVLLLGYIK